jgi:F0F1-type ATP synthase membrane subunit b/b'
MESFNQVFFYLVENNNITLNSNILETGLINILGLIAILIYVGQDFLSSLLEERKTNIVNSIQNAENRLNEANQRLNEAKKQLSQSDIVINNIKNETLNTKKFLLNSDIDQCKKDLRIRFNRALSSFRSKEQQIFIEIKQQIILLILKRTVKRAQETFSKKDRATLLINETINKLEGDLI